MKLILILVYISSLFANDLYWYSDTQKTQIYNLGYDGKYNSFIYSNSKNIKAKKMILTNNIILAFKQQVTKNVLFGATCKFKSSGL